MNRIKVCFLFLPLFFFMMVQPGFAQSQPAASLASSYESAYILSTREKEIGTTHERVQRIKARVTSGEDKGRVISLENESENMPGMDILVHTGENVLLRRETGPPVVYYVADHYRIPYLNMLFAAFLLLAILVGGLRILWAVLWITFFYAATIFWVFPGALEGLPPIVPAFLIGILFIVGFSAKRNAAFGHAGFKPYLKAWAATVLAGIIATGLFYLIICFAGLSGAMFENQLYLPQSFPHLSLLQLMLAGFFLISTAVYTLLSWCLLQSPTFFQDGTSATDSEYRSCSTPSQWRCFQYRLRSGQPVLVRFIMSGGLFLLGLFFSWWLNGLSDSFLKLINSEASITFLCGVICLYIGLVLLLPLQCVFEFADQKDSS